MKLFQRLWRALVGGPLPTGSKTRLDPAKEANAVYVVCSSAQCADVGELVQTMDDQEQVISCFAMADEVSQFSPQLAQLYHCRGLHCRGKGEYDNAIANCTEAIRLDPSLARAYANRGVAYGMKSDHDKAISDFTEAIRLDPSLAEVYCDRGVTYAMKGDYDKAIDDFTEVIRLESSSTEAYRNRAVAYGMRGEYDNAVTDYIEAIQLCPELGEVYSDPELPYWDCIEQDVRYCTVVIGNDPENAGAYYRRGLAYEKKSDLDKAIADYTEVIRERTMFCEFQGTCSKCHETSLVSASLPDKRDMPASFYIVWECPECGGENEVGGFPPSSRPTSSRPPNSVEGELESA